ncbi:hypothetical protein CRYUN_Cryun12cG0158000 [Craigia yunnanensis]
MIQQDDLCDICGDVGFAEDIVSCFQCKIAKEHGYCMREVVLTIPEIWFCEECRLSKAIASPKTVIVEYTSESVCTNPLLKLSGKSVHGKKEMASKSNTSKTLSPGRFLKNQERSGLACKQVDAKIGNVKKSAGPLKFEHLASNLVSSLDQSSTMATVSTSSPTRFKAASSKLFVTKIKASHEHGIKGHSNARFGSITQQKANQTSKNLKDKKTSAICEKETHDTFIPAEKIETSQAQRRDSKQVFPEGLVSLPVDMIASTLTESDLEKIALEYHIDTNRYHLSLPKSSQRANTCFPYKHTFCIYADAFKAGLRLPLHPLIPEILHEFGVALTQIPPNSWRILVCFISFCCSKKITPTVNLFRAICSLNYHFGDGKGWWFFSARVGFKLFEGFPSSIKGWRNRFLIISTSERDTLGVNTKWGHPNSAANELSTLSSKEVKSLDDLVATATNNPPDFRVLLSEEALIQAGISSALLNSKGFKDGMIDLLESVFPNVLFRFMLLFPFDAEVKQFHSLSQSGLVRALKRKRASTETGESSGSTLPCQEPILVDEDEEGQPKTKRPEEPHQPMEEMDLLQPTELTNQSQEIVPPVTSALVAPNDSPHEVLPQQASPKSSIQRIAVASAPTVSSISSGTATGGLPPSNAKVMRTGSVEYRREQSVFTHPALARELISEMVLPHDCDYVAQDTLDMAQELMGQAMENVTWKMGVSQKLIKMDLEINMLKGERNALRTKLESEKMAVAELESTRKATIELQSLSEEQTQRLEKEVQQLEIRLKETEEKAWTWEDEFAKLKRRLKQAEDRAESAERKVVVAEEKWHLSELAKSRVVEETIKNFKASREFQNVVEDYHAEAYGLGLDVAIKKIKRQFPDLDLSIIDFYAE